MDSMETRPLRRLCTLLLLSAAPLAAQSECKPVFEALDKVMGTPTHFYVTTNVNGKPKTTETIYHDGAIYSNTDGKWTKAPYTTKQVADTEQENRRKSVYICSYLKEEPVNGQKAAVYSTHTSVLSGDKTDGQMWISKDTGLPLRNEADSIPGGKDAKKTHYSVRYDYTKVVPPRL
jgi:hypothetical protein